MIYLILPLNRKNSTVIASQKYDIKSNNNLNVAYNNKTIRNMDWY